VQVWATVIEPGKDQRFLHGGEGQAAFEMCKSDPMELVSSKRANLKLFISLNCKGNQGLCASLIFASQFLDMLLLNMKKIFSSFKKQRWITLVDFMFVQRMTADWHSSVMFAKKLLLKDKAVNCTGSDSSYCKV